MMDNYPPGVTGNEFQIQGEAEDNFKCPNCGCPVPNSQIGKQHRRQ